ncbi:MAG: hemerythrin domain-containing protein [Burkholderiales bacterium]|nr:hemerythrin domain-containing protein [Burkholderiales bacterium]
MIDPIAAWHAEHTYFTRLLALLQEQVDVFAAGEVPNYQLMLDILDYLHDWGDQYHHPREDEAFRRMMLRNPGREPLLRRLMQEHRVINRAGDALRTLLEEALDDAMVSRAEIEVAAATYLVYYGNHIAKEEEDVMPGAAQDLTQADWKAVFEAARGGHDPLFGDHPEARFRELRRRISHEAA